SLERDSAERFYRAAAPFAHLLRRQILFISAERVRGALQSRTVHLCSLYALVRVREADADREPEELPRVGAQSIWREAVLGFFQDLHGESVGHVVRRDFRR